MVLSELLKAIQPIQIIGSTETEITRGKHRLSLGTSGHLFMAMRGTQTDGHVYIPAAIEKGAVAVLCEDEPEAKQEGITYIQDERQRRRCRQSSHYILRRSYFQDGTSRRNRTNGRKRPSPPYYIIHSVISVIR